MLLVQNFMRDTFVEKGQQFAEIIDAHISKRPDEAVNIQGMFFGFTMDR